MNQTSIHEARNALVRALAALDEPTVENVAAALLQTTVALSRLAQQDAICLLSDALEKFRRGA